MVRLSENFAPQNLEDIDEDLRAGDGNEFAMDAAALGMVPSGETRMEGALALHLARRGLAVSQEHTTTRDTVAGVLEQKIAALPKKRIKADDLADEVQA